MPPLQSDGAQCQVLRQSPLPMRRGEQLHHSSTPHPCKSDTAELSCALSGRAPAPSGILVPPLALHQSGAVTPAQQVHLWGENVGGGEGSRV